MTRKSLTRLSDIAFGADLPCLVSLGGRLGTLLVDRGFMELPQFGLHRLVVWLIDEHVHGGPAGICAGAVHQAAQLMLPGRRGNKPFGNVLAAEKLKFCWRHERVDIERRCAPSE